jgi:hypothetical protein
MSPVLFLLILVFLNVYDVHSFVKPLSIRRFMPLEATTLGVSLTNDDGVTKTVVTPGTGNPVQTGDILAVEYKARVAGSQTPFAKADKERFVFADGSLIKGWDIGVGSMRIGESAIFNIKSTYAYGAKGVIPVIQPNSDVEIEIKILAWLGNQMRPESLFQKDLDIDPFVASSPEAIQQEYDEMQEAALDKYEGNVLDIYIRRIKNISFGFGGSGFFQSQSGERPPLLLNPNITFPAMILFSISLFALVFNFGGIKEKGERPVDLDVALEQIDIRTSTGLS